MANGCVARWALNYILLRLTTLKGRGAAFDPKFISSPQAFAMRGRSAYTWREAPTISVGYLEDTTDIGWSCHKTEVSLSMQRRVEKTVTVCVLSLCKNDCVAERRLFVCHNVLTDLRKCHSTTCANWTKFRATTTVNEQEAQLPQRQHAMRM